MVVDAVGRDEPPSVLPERVMKRENYRQTLMVAYVTTGLAQFFELAYNYLFFIVLSVEQIGLYSWVLAIVMFFNVAVNMGIEPVLVRKFGQQELPLSRAFRAILLLRLPLIALGLVMATILHTHAVLNSSQYVATMLMGGQIIFNVSDGVFKSWLLANNSQNVVNLINILFSGLKLGLIGIMFASSWSSLYVLLLGILIFRFMASLVSWILAYALSSGSQALTTANPPTGRVVQDLFRAGLSVGGVNFLGIIQNRLDWLLVSGMISTLALASYSLANKLYEILQLIIGVSLQTVYPWLCRNQENERRSLLLLVRMVVAGGALLGLCGLFIAPPAIRLMFGNKFAGTDPAIKLMMLSASIIAASSVFYHFALSRGWESKLLLITAITTLSQFAANLYLIPRLGITGAALGMLVLAVTTIAGLTALTLAGRIIPRVIVRRILAFLSAAVLCVTILLYADMAGLIVPLLVGTVVVGEAWLILFSQDERIYLAERLHGSVREFAVGIKGVSFRTHFRWE